MPDRDTHTNPYKLTVHGREVIALDSLAHTKRFAEERFRQRRCAPAEIRWENIPEGGYMLTWKVPVWDHFHTSSYIIREEV